MSGSLSGVASGVTMNDLLRMNGLPASVAGTGGAGASSFSGSNASGAPGYVIGGVPHISTADILGGQPQSPDALTVNPVDLPTPNIHPGFFQQGGTGQKIAAILGPVLGTLGDSLMTRQGGQPIYTNMMKLQEQMRDGQIDRQLKMAQIAKALHPDAPSDNYDRIVARLGQTAGDNYLSTLAAGPPMAIDQINPTTHQTERTFAYRSQLPNAFGHPPSPQGSSPSGPTTGTVVDGYRFKGGDPSDQNNWEAATPAGGASVIGSPTFPDPTKAPGTMTSGRRTVAGNAAVGGVPNSHHLDGDAADYVGTTPAALSSYFGPAARILNEGNHVHVTLPGYHRVPYFGARGTVGA